MAKKILEASDDIIAGIVSIMGGSRLGWSAKSATSDANPNYFRVIFRNADGLGIYVVTHDGKTLRAGASVWTKDDDDLGIRGFGLRDAVMPYNLREEMVEPNSINITLSDSITPEKIGRALANRLIKKIVPFMPHVAALREQYKNLKDKKAAAVKKLEAIGYRQSTHDEHTLYATGHPGKPTLTVSSDGSVRIDRFYSVSADKMIRIIAILEEKE